MFVDGAGSIVVAGTARVGAHDRVALARLNGNGTLDMSFDGDGKATFGVAGQHVSANDVAAAPGGKIVTAGGVESDFLVVRFNADGTPDTTFGGGDAWAGIGFDGDQRANGLVVQGDGTIVAAGSTAAGPGDSDVAVIRLDATGALDSSFSGDGKFNGNFSTDGADFGNGIALDSSNRLVIAGST